MRRPPLSPLRAPLSVLRGTALYAAWLGAGAAAAPAQQPQPVRLGEAAEIGLARSAAPPAVSAEADVWVLRGDHYALAVPGSNGNACMVGRSRVRSLEPICYDREGARTLLPREIRRLELRLRGLGAEEAATRIEAETAAGDLPLPRRPTLAWMMSAGQRLIAPDGREVGRWKPHVMLYAPGVSGEELGIPAPTEHVMLFEEDGQVPSLVVVVPRFIEPRPEGETAAGS